jgi:CRISPR system Cascade subunit CasA
LNLLNEQWIPIRRASGLAERIAPHELTQHIDSDPVVALDAPRPDFNGALIQFLIGLVQTAWVRADKYWDRDEMLRSPPTPEALHALFSPLRGAFELDGDGPRFMQDFVQRPTWKENESRDIRALLIEAPGKETLDQNRDHFVKRNAVEAMCLHCTATGLFTLQIQAPNGGRGHLPSLRKGGEITTLVVFSPAQSSLRPALWRDLVSNVLETSQLNSLCDASKVSERFTFPWMAAIENLQPVGGQTWPRDVHPAHLFWPMPRRIRLDFDKVRVGRCDVCGVDSVALVTRYCTWPNGLNYNGQSKEEKSKLKDGGVKQKRSSFPNWQHPLSPYEKSAIKSIPLSLDSGGLTYRHWLGCALGSNRHGKEILPAAAVQAFRSTRAEVGQVRLWAFGYEMDNMKARCWYETTFPLFDLPAAESSELIVSVIDLLIGAAESTAEILRDAVRDARVKANDSQRRDPTWREATRSNVAFVEASLWNRTERDFFALVERTIGLAKQYGRDAFDQSTPLRRGWLRTLRLSARRLFDEIAASGNVEAGNPAKLADAHRSMCERLKGKGLEQALGLKAADPPDAAVGRAAELRCRKQLRRHDE